jgi:signal transduction histidine kinase
VFENQQDGIKVLYSYRFISLFITSLFFFFGSSSQSIVTKAFIITCISVSAIILNYLYISSYESKNKILVLVIIETIGNNIILIPSGGINSPYVWYSLNTLLVAGINLGNKYIWLSLFIYLFGSTGLFLSIFQHTEIGIDHFLNSKDLILSLVLISCTIQLMAGFIKKIKMKNDILLDTNQQLKQANQKIKASISHIMELYEAVELFSTVKDKKSLLEQVLNCTHKITRANFLFFYDLIENNQLIVKSVTSEKSDTRKQLEEKIVDVKEKVLCSDVPIELIIDNKSFLLISVKTNYLTYGILGIERGSQEKIDYSESIDQLEFLSGLCSITLEKFELEQVNERLIITEEQNRIACEIHDSALQRLFSISCGIYGLIKNQTKLNINQITEELNLIRDSINNTMKELRSAIYGMSWAKGGQSNFGTDISNYINEICRLNNVEITFNIVGNHELLTSLQRKAFYRIICEGISNAVHHGQATQIQVKFFINVENILLFIIDNGIGFDVMIKKDEDYQRGLGLKNIQNLVFTLRGKINIDSTIGKGTSLEISIPAAIESLKGEVV